jgi:hypothetical protein|tara:strand:+ start:4750 stop:5091 length:342 start_codon:yes stop_codon:yes gene_type:complete
MSNSELVPVVVNLNAAREEKLNESFLTMFGSAVESMLNQMFGGSVIDTPSSAVIRGTPSQVAAFGDTLSKEKKYMESFLKHGLNDPRSFRNRHELERSIGNFERETGMKWPFK